MVEELAVVMVVEAPHPTVAKNVFYDVLEGLKRSKRVKKGPPPKKSKKSNFGVPPLFRKKFTIWYFFFWRIP